MLVGPSVHELGRYWGWGAGPDHRSSPVTRCRGREDDEPQGRGPVLQPGPESHAQPQALGEVGCVPGSSASGGGAAPQQAAGGGNTYLDGCRLAEGGSSYVSV